MTRAASVLLVAVALSAALVAIGATALYALSAARANRNDSHPSDLARFAMRCGTDHAAWRIAACYAGTDAARLPTNLHQTWRNEFGPLDPGNLASFPRGEFLSTSDRDGRNTPADRPLWQTLGVFHAGRPSNPMGYVDKGSVLTTGYARHFEPGNVSGTTSYGAWQNPPVAGNVARFNGDWSLSADPAMARYRLRYAVAVEDLSGKLLIGFQEPDSIHTSSDPERGETAKLDELRGRILYHMIGQTEVGANGNTCNDESDFNSLSLVLRWANGGGGDGGLSRTFEQFYQGQTPLSPPSASIPPGWPTRHHWTDSTNHGWIKILNGTRAPNDGWVHDFTAPTLSWAYFGGQTWDSAGVEGLGALRSLMVPDQDFFQQHDVTPFGTWPRLPGGARRTNPWTSVNLLTASSSVVRRLVGGAMDWREILNDGWKAWSNPYNLLIPSFANTRYPSSTWETDPTAPSNSPITPSAGMDIPLEALLLGGKTRYKASYSSTRDRSTQTFIFYKYTSGLKDPLLGINATCQIPFMGNQPFIFPTKPNDLPDEITGTQDPPPTNGDPPDTITVKTGNLGRPISIDSFWLDAYAAATQAVLTARCAWDPARGTVDGPAKAIRNTPAVAPPDFDDYPAIEFVDRAFCRFFGRELNISLRDSTYTTSDGNRYTGKITCLKGAGAGINTVTTLTSINPFNLEDTSPYIGFDFKQMVTIHMPSGADPNRIADDAERILNNLRVSLFASASFCNRGIWDWEYRNFVPLDFDNSGTATCDVGALADPTATNAGRFCVSGGFSMKQRSRFYRILSRGEVFDTLKRVPVAIQQSMSVFVCDANGDLGTPTGSLNDSYIIYRWALPEKFAERPRDPLLFP